MDKKSARIRRATRARRKLQELGATRLVVHRTPRHIYAQVIAPNGSEVLVAASTVEKAIAEQLKYTGNKDAAAAVGKAVAERALEKGIKDVSFDRSGFQYHGRVQALAGTFGSRLHEYARTRVNTFNRVLQGAVIQRDVNHIATGFFHRFLDRCWNFTRFTVTKTNATVTIANYSQSCEGENTTTFNGFRYAVYW